VVVSTLVDTGAMLALLDRDDRWHGPCVDAFAELTSRSSPLRQSSPSSFTLWATVGAKLRRRGDSFARAP